MPLIISILILLLSGAMIMATLLFCMKILCEGVVGIIPLTTMQSKQLGQKNCEAVAKNAKNMDKVEKQIADILKKQRF